MRISCLITEFDKLHRLILRQTVISEPLPVPFVKLLISLDDTLAGAQGAKKKMNATNAKALNSMKQKLKKVQREFETVLVSYRAVRVSFTFSIALISYSAVSLQIKLADANLS